LPRGIFEAEVAGLTPLASKFVSVPIIAGCPVNLECRVEFRVVGASVNEEYLHSSRTEIVNFFPTYEVDDQTNPFGGAIERLGVNGELLECPSFPVGPKRSFRADPFEWCSDLAEAGFLMQMLLTDHRTQSWEHAEKALDAFMGMPENTQLADHFSIGD
jgi:hypothetical protein